MSVRTLHVIAPAWNEEECVPDFVRAVRQTAENLLHSSATGVHLVLVDDGSTDATFSVIRSLAAGSTAACRLTGIQLSRNFGQQAAIHAGLTHARGMASKQDLFAVMDCDLQHPPSLLPEMVVALDSGSDQVQMVRSEPDSIPWSKKVTSRLYYRLLHALSGLKFSAGSADFRGLNLAVLDAYLSLPESGRFNRALFHWLGFRTVEIPYEAAPRAGGRTHYSLGRMFSLGLNGLLQFSSKPLVLSSFFIVLLSFIFCAGYLVYEAVHYFQGVQFVLGWPSIMFFIAFWSGAIALNQLLSALYVARIFDEVKARPAFLIRSICGDSDAG